MGSGGIAPSFFTSALDGCKLSASRPGHFKIDHYKKVKESYMLHLVMITNECSKACDILSTNYV
jgi:hypothetical protein